VLGVQHHTDPLGVEFAIQPVGDLLGEPLLHLRSGAKCSTSRASLESPRAERYGPSATPIAVVSRSLRLDWDARCFTAPLARPILLTVAQASPDQVARATEVADVVIAGDQDVDLATALAALGDRG
jgi:riboflavin biosynthesis pyrimidine reductase